MGADRKRARLEPAQVQEVLDEVAELVERLIGGLEQLGAVGVGHRDVVAAEAGDDGLRGSQRCAEVVSDRRQQSGAQAVRCVELGGLASRGGAACREVDHPTHHRGYHREDDHGEDVGGVVDEEGVEGSGEVEVEQGRAGESGEEGWPEATDDRRDDDGEEEEQCVARQVQSSTQGCQRGDEQKRTGDTDCVADRSSPAADAARDHGSSPGGRGNAALDLHCASVER